MNNEQQMSDLLQSCEREPLEHSGMIQSFGALLAIRKEDSIISHVSENIQDFVGMTSTALLNKTLNSVLPDFNLALNRLDGINNSAPYVYHNIRLNDKRLDIKISCINQWIVFDLEQCQAKKNSIWRMPVV